MPVYHCYALNQQDHVKANYVVTAGSDEAAVEKAKAYFGGQRRFTSIELWREGERIVALARERV